MKGVDFVFKSLSMMAGEKIFIPRFPSMKIVDVARAIVPDTKHEIIGIRPGDRLHEFMITRDDAINTLKFDDFYVIRPAFSWWELHEADSQWYAFGRPVPDDFQYSSDLNDRWLDIEGFRKLMEEAHA